MHKQQWHVRCKETQSERRIREYISRIPFIQLFQCLLFHFCRWPSLTKPTSCLSNHQSLLSHQSVSQCFHACSKSCNTIIYLTHTHLVYSKTTDYALGCDAVCLFICLFICGIFNALSETHGSTVSNVRMISEWWIGMMWKEEVVSQFKKRPRNFPRGSEKNHRSYSITCSRRESSCASPEYKPQTSPLESTCSLSRCVIRLTDTLHPEERNCNFIPIY